MKLILPYLAQKFFLDSGGKLNLLLLYEHDFLFLLLLHTLYFVEFQMNCLFQFAAL